MSAAILCNSCGTEKRAGARFCDSCGAALAPRCAGCDRELRPDARFCDACGRPTGAASPAASERASPPSRTSASGSGGRQQKPPSTPAAPAPTSVAGGRYQVERLLGGLPETEARVVRMYHLEGQSYQQISSALGMAENSIGPILSRAREKMRRAGVNPATG